MREVSGEVAAVSFFWLLSLLVLLSIMDDTIWLTDVNLY